MTVFALKLIAVFAMLLDHIGAVFFPDAVILRIIGRIAFPLFAWFISNGVLHTKDPFAYAHRLFLFACISEIPFFLAFYDGYSAITDTHRNVFFTLLLGLLSLIIIRSERLGKLRYVLASIPAIVAYAFNTDYGAYGVALIVFFYSTHSIAHRWKRLLIQVLGMSLLLYAHVQNVSAYFFALAALPLIALYNGKPGPRYTRFFYWFYPIHLLLFGLIRWYLFFF